MERKSLSGLFCPIRQIEISLFLQHIYQNYLQCPVLHWNKQLPLYLVVIHPKETVVRFCRFRHLLEQLTYVICLDGMKKSYCRMLDIRFSRTHFLFYDRQIPCFFNTFSFKASHMAFPIFQSPAQKEVPFRRLYYSYLIIVDGYEIYTCSIDIFNIIFHSKYFVHLLSPINPYLSFCF